MRKRRKSGAEEVDQSTGTSGVYSFKCRRVVGEGLTEKVKFKPRLVAREGGRHATMRAEGNSGEIGGKYLREAGLGRQGLMGLGKEFGFS